MASMENESTAPRYSSLHELLSRAEELGLSVQLSVHSVPLEAHIEWLQLGLLDAIEKGAAGNPATGKMESGAYPGGKASAVVFTEDEQERRRRIRREEDAAVDELAESLERVVGQ